MRGQKATYGRGERASITHRKDIQPCSRRAAAKQKLCTAPSHGPVPPHVLLSDAYTLPHDILCDRARVAVTQTRGHPAHGAGEVHGRRARAAEEVQDREQVRFESGWRGEVRWGRRGGQGALEIEDDG